MKAYMKEYENWLTNPVFDEETRKEVAAMKDEKQIEDAFYKQLSFGTGGLRGIIGAGTGLGTASLIRDSHGSWLPLPAEGGHVIFPFIGKEEAAFQDFAARELGLACLSGDDVLSGRGLRLLHLFLTGERREAHEIAAEALGSETGTLRWYARFYARACRNWALSTLCTGGLFITGGIALRNPLVTECAAFREAFYEGPHRKLLERIPVRRFTDMNSGLWGSAWFGMRMTA